MTGDEFVASLGDAAKGTGWTLVRQQITETQIVLGFVRNDSPYGEKSSVHRSRQKIAVMSDVLARQIAEQQKQVGFGGTRIETDGPT